MQKILLVDALRPASRERLLATKKRSPAGERRLRAGLPRDGVLARKTGTVDRGTVNHVDGVWPPNRRPILTVLVLPPPAPSVRYRGIILSAPPLQGTSVKL